MVRGSGKENTIEGWSLTDLEIGRGPERRGNSVLIRIDLRGLLYTVYTNRMRNGDECVNPRIVQTTENVSTMVEKKSPHRADPVGHARW